MRSTGAAWRCCGSAAAREALASFERALALAPDHVDALGNRGNALLALNRPG